LLLAAGLAMPAHGAEPGTPLDQGAVEETARLLRRDTNFVILFIPGGPAQLRVYPDRGGVLRNDAVTEAAPAPADAEEDERLRAEALASPDSDRRAAALHRLLGTELGLKTALEVLARETDAEVLKSALDVLTGYTSVPLEPIFTAVRNQHPEVRIQALELLTLHRTDPRVEAVIAAAATSDSDEDVRASARALIGLEDSR
jgi:hypothetical protein